MFSKRGFVFCLLVLALLGLAMFLMQKDWQSENSATTQSLPRLEAVGCWFELRKGWPPLDCFHVYLPQSKTNTDNIPVRLPVVRIKSQAVAQGLDADPVLVLGAGGPGSPLGLGTREFGSWLIDDFEGMSLARGRDLYLMDPRGVGEAVPELLCPELVVFWKESLQQKLDAQQLRDHMLVALTTCKSRYESQGIELRHYTNDQVAADIASIFQLFEIPQWNLYGVSYGASYALSVLHRYPHFVRALVLDSAGFSDRLTMVEEARATDAALELLFKACEQDKDCRLRHPSLRQQFDLVFQRLNREPLRVPVDHPFTDDRLNLFIEGDMLAYIVISAMYEHHYPLRFPQLVKSLAAGDTEELQQQLMPFLSYTLFSRFSDLVLYANHCSLSYYDSDYDVLAEEYRRSRYAQVGADMLVVTQAVCDVLDMPPSAVVEPEQLAPVPILFLQGGLDPVTQAQGFQERRTRFRNYRYVLAPKLSHSLLSAGECYEAVAGEFLENPRAKDPMAQVPICQSRQDERGSSHSS